MLIMCLFHKFFYLVMTQYLCWNLCSNFACVYTFVLYWFVKLCWKSPILKEYKKSWCLIQCRKIVDLAPSLRKTSIIYVSTLFTSFALICHLSADALNFPRRTHQILLRWIQWMLYPKTWQLDLVALARGIDRPHCNTLPTTAFWVWNSYLLPFLVH